MFAFITPLVTYLRAPTSSYTRGWRPRVYANLVYPRLTTLSDVWDDSLVKIFDRHARHAFSDRSSEGISAEVSDVEIATRLLEKGIGG